MKSEMLPADRHGDDLGDRNPRLKFHHSANPTDMTPQEIEQVRSMQNLIKLSALATNVLQYAAPNDCPELKRRIQIRKSKLGNPQKPLTTVKESYSSITVICEGEDVATSLHPCNFCAINKTKGGVTIQKKDMS